MCGKCCRVATTPHKYAELVELVKNGDEEATDFLDIFDPYESFEAARKIDASVVDNVVARLENSVCPPDEITFYRCKYIQDSNLCGKYENRPQLCKRFPTSPWSIVPPGCGYEGWLFQQREDIKRRIRKQKESKLELQAELKTITNPELAKKVEATIQNIDKTIECYAKFGSADW